MGAPVGNQNARKAKLWEAAIKRSLAKHSDDGTLNMDRGLERLADNLVEAAASKEQWALKEIGDRIDGKPAQTIGSDPDQPLTFRGMVELVSGS